MVEKIIEDMKREGLHWSEPNIPSLSPHNPVSGTVYQGGNRFHLGFVGDMRGVTDHRWCTGHQIRDSGWHLKTGAKAALIEKWREFSIKEENKDTGEKEVTGHYLRCVGYWNVFNASEIEGIPAPPVPEHVSDRTAAIAGDLIRRGPRPRSSRNGASSPSRRRTRTRVRKRSPATTCAAWAIGTSSTPARLRASPPHRYRSM